MCIFLRNSVAEFSPSYSVLQKILNTFPTMNIKTSLHLIGEFRRCYFWYWSNSAKPLHIDRPLWPCRDSLISVVFLQTYSIDHYYITSSGLCSAEYLRAHLNPYLLIRARNFRHILKLLQNQYDKCFTDYG